MFSYNTENGLIQDITPSEDNEDFKILRNCQGLRSAGAHNGVAFFGGPGLYASDLKDAASSAFAAFDADRGKFISASSMSEVDGCAVTNVRRWIVYDDVLYVGTKVITKEGKTRGAILRWYGDKSDPWQFHIVGWVPMDAAEITIFNGKMYVGTWGGAPERQYTSSVCCSETIPAGGLQPVTSDEKDWQILWSVSEYEHFNSNGRQITSVAGFKAWRGHLYWGMFAPSFMLLSTASDRYDDLTSPDAISFLLGNHRQTTLWRLDTDNKVELLYGETRLPKWNQQDDTWSFDETGWTPKWGRAGYGNIWCIYTWAMHEYNDKLYLGTMDCSNLIDAVNDNSSGGINLFGMLKTLTNTSDSSYGFEILVMDDEEKVPTFITKDGFGNHDAYGVRNFGVLDHRLFVGTASPFNLAEHGGWRIITIEDKTIATSVEQSKIIEPGIVYKTEAGSITMASVDGEDITSIEIYDVAGKLINKIAPNAHTITFPLDAAGVIVAKITTKSGTWTGKITNQ